MNDKPALEVLPCNECSAGMMRPRFLTYFTWLGEELITVQNFPAWVCDVCGHREYDEKSISWLSMLLDPNAGKPTRKTPVSRRARPGTTTRPRAES
jgi:YgiT-type zinc finger domain-containing protein